MGVRDVSDIDIREKASAFESEQKRLESQKERLRQKICDCERRLGENKSTMQLLQTRQILLRQAAFIQKCIPENVAALRSRLRELNALASREDITVAEQKRAFVQSEQTRTELRKSCPHPLVIYSTGYDGSRCDDYDDAYRGCHACVVCGLLEYDDDYKGANSTFPDDGTRLRNRLYDEYADYREASTSTLTSRIADYNALATCEEIVDMFFGAARLARLKNILSKE